MNFKNLSRLSMLKFQFTFPILFLFLIPLSGSNNQHSAESDQYKLVWADEFEYIGKPDPANWGYEKGFVRNEEFQWYQKDNAYCKNGKLIIEGRRERKQNPSYVSGSNDWRKSREYAEFTSSSLLTRGLHHWLYGRFEIRAKIDTRSGLWPAFWTLGINGHWPHNGEIDIMEYYKGKLLANVAWGGRERWQPIWNTYILPLDSLKKNDRVWSDKFHVWRMDWDEHNISLYLDDMLMNTTDLSNTYNKDTDGINPFYQPHYIIINLAIGGTAGGDPSQTIFPAYYEIDYVRVYQK
jgi:beta-glucanase (GH16 family)